MRGHAGSAGRIGGTLAAALIAALMAALVAAFLAGLPARAAPRAGASECLAEPARAEILEGIGLRGEIRLASGARVVLDSVRWPDAPETAAAARAWLDARRGAALVVTPRGPPDRWDRRRADIQGAEGDADLAGGLIGAGLAFADANEADSLCRPALRLVEAAARRNGLGLWGAPVPAATDGPALRALAGHFAVVEGRLRHVGERGARTYLDFAPRGADGLTVTVSKRTWRMVRARGLSAASLEGRPVRVRGILDVRRGPTLEAGADAIEVLGEADRPEAGPEADGGLRR
ncbi:pentapeptide repeat-containing protein [Methylobacterium sp. J-026]|uniref:pentapeptide repeat-containing protein n=1 Tax=Methylobacterium sp. J-026 TaxID=2836624 RepID=UPI001FB88AAD|nr:pentapeptide repeat-containing protein [Methylobacterium sp. J-026]MCJ2136501.1 pentapeptide repeat-containing protein [Methylobacterium sp. J-026]